MDDRLRLGREMLEIGKANTVYARRLPAAPPAPHEPAHVEQKRRVVCQGAYGTTVLAVAIGRIDVATSPTNRWKSETGELDT